MMAREADIACSKNANLSDGINNIINILKNDGKNVYIRYFPDGNVYYVVDGVRCNAVDLAKIALVCKKTAKPNKEPLKKKYIAAQSKLKPDANIARYKKVCACCSKKYIGKPATKYCNPCGEERRKNNYNYMSNLKDLDCTQCGVSFKARGDITICMDCRKNTKLTCQNCGDEFEGNWQRKKCPSCSKKRGLKYQANYRKKQKDNEL